MSKLPYFANDVVSPPKSSPSSVLARFPNADCVVVFDAIVASLAPSSYAAPDVLSRPPHDWNYVESWLYVNGTTNNHTVRRRRKIMKFVFDILFVSRRN